MMFSVIIPTYNDWYRLKQCVTALEAQTLSDDQYEIIVVNNSETKRIPEEIYFSERVQLIHEAQPGSYIARNRGVQASNGEIMVFTDSDCCPDKDWLKNSKKYFDGGVELLGGKVEIFNSDDGSKYGYIYERATAFPQHKNVPTGRGVTANLFVKKSVFKKVGGFDSSVKSGGDWDLTLRCTDVGYQLVYADDVIVNHPARNLRSIFKKCYRLTCGGALNIQKKYGHTCLRILGSHLKSGLSGREKDLAAITSRNERMIVFSIDVLKFFYRTIIYTCITLRLIDPEKIRE